MNLIQKLNAKLGAHKSCRGGDELLFVCPKCQRKKFYVNIKKHVFNCVRCGYAGVLRSIVPEHSHKYKQIKPVVLKPNEVITPFVIPGYVPTPKPSEYVLSYLKGRRLTTIPRAVGISTDRMLQGRMIIPIIENNTIVSYVARSIYGSTPKELSGPDKAQYLYNIDTINQGDKVIITEGIFDCMMVESVGFKAIAIMGSHMSDVQIGKLLQKKPEAIVLMLDNDMAGINGTVDAYAKIVRRFHGKIYTAGDTEYKDPGDMPYWVIAKLIQKTLED